ncbi:MAG: single-stranded-DNA-specific exonuclease RecJ [Proteobacteria bacterium]|nr:single-stranded-DNA-specific exonuclease RecJ [Pseudomonadota bacterium]
MNIDFGESHTGQAWRFTPPQTSVLSVLQSNRTISPLLASLLAQRGILTSEAATDFLATTLRSLPSPLLMKGMADAVGLIYRAIKNNTLIIIYGDYDVDGVTATALLIRFLTELAADCQSCHPDRFVNGYGLNAELVETTFPNRTGLVITVDCGISDLEEVKRLVERGWQVIITDHHQPPLTLPKAHAIINPWQEGCQFPSRDLAGVGVAFYLVMGIRSHFHQQHFWRNTPPPNLKKYLDLVAVGTISDMVPLQGVNRVLAKAGLEVLSRTENQGLSAIMGRCHIQKGQKVTHEDIAFQVGPRLNAAGRMGDASRASTLLASENNQLVVDLANNIELANMDRREQTSKLVNQAIEKVMEQGEESHPCIILHGTQWHLGILGIVASKLVDIFHKPAIVFGGEGVLKGSARSIPGVNIHKLIAECAKEGRILGYGGHSNAAGMSIMENDLFNFQSVMHNKFITAIEPAMERTYLAADYIVDSKTSFTELEQAWSQLAPYGQGNREPIFITGEPCRLRNMQVIGKEKNHMRFSVYLGGRWLDGIGFGFGSIATRGVAGETELSIAFSLREDRFNGYTKIKIGLVDVFTDWQKVTV